MGLRRMQHDEGRAFLVAARAARLARAKKEDYEAAMKRESHMLGLG